MSEENLFDKFSSLMDQNIRGVQLGIYAVAGAGFLIAMRSVRPLKKFIKPSDIPQHFIERRMKFNGKVMNVQGKVLYVDHYPVIALPFREPADPGLPVKISSVNVTPNGGIWLNTLVRGREISFVPLRRDHKTVEAIVYKKRQDIGQHLTSIGFATVETLDLNLDKDPVYSKYYKGLISSQLKAVKNDAGIWNEKEQGRGEDLKLIASLRVFRNK